MLDAFVTELAEKRVSRPQRKEGEGWTLSGGGLRKQSVNDFVRRAVSADSNEVAYTALVGLARDFGGLPGRGSGSHIHFDAAGSKAFERGSEEFAPLTAASSRIYDCEITLPQDFESPSRRRMQSAPH